MEQTTGPTTPDDRAVFHFLTDVSDRKSYVELARRTVPEGGHLIVASFADEGPKRPSWARASRSSGRPGRRTRRLGAPHKPSSTGSSGGNEPNHYPRIS